MKKAEWWINECGGVLCSNCGYFHDDYYYDPPKQCPSCGLEITNDSDIIIDNYYRMSKLHSAFFMDEKEYPEWLLNLKEKYAR